MPQYSKAIRRSLTRKAKNNDLHQGRDVDCIPFHDHWTVGGYACIEGKRSLAGSWQYYCECNLIPNLLVQTASCFLCQLECHDNANQ